MAGPSKTSALQTSFNAAAVIIAAELNAGLLTDLDIVPQALSDLKDSIYSELSETVENDTTAAALVGGTFGGNRSNGGSQSFSPTEAGATVLNYGKFKGLTIAEVAAVTPQEAVGYGYVDKAGNGRAGTEWLKWAANSQDSKVRFIGVRASSYLNSIGVAA